MPSGDVCAAILAGGKGSRFKPFTDIIPKPLMPIGEDERPILEYIIAWIASYKLKRVVLLVGYKWKQIRNYFGHGERYGVRIEYSVDDAEYSGTGGALLKAYKSGLLRGCRHVLVWYGDILASVDVDDLFRYHVLRSARATLVVARRYQLPVGVAVVDENMVVKRFMEKPWLDLNVTIGVLELDLEGFERVEEHLGKSFDLMGDYIPWLINRGERVVAYLYDDVWYDVGSLERYVKIPGEVVKRMEERLRLVLGSSLNA